MNLETAPIAVALFFMAAIVLTGFTLYAHQSGKIRKLYTAMAGGLLALIFAILIVLMTANLAMASVVALVIFVWFLAMSRKKKVTQRIFDIQE